MNNLFQRMKEMYKRVSTRVNWSALKGQPVPQLILINTGVFVRKKDNHS